MRARLAVTVAIAACAAVSLLHAAVAAAHDARTAAGRTSRDARWPPPETTADRDGAQPPAATQGPPRPLRTTGRQSSSSDQYHTLSSLLASSASEGGQHHDGQHHDDDGPHHPQHHRQHQKRPAAGDVYPEAQATAGPPSYAGGGSLYGRETTDRVGGGAWTADQSTGDRDATAPPPRWVAHSGLTNRLANPSQNFGTATALFSTNRQLKKYGPLIVETEVTTTDVGGGGGSGGGGGGGGSGPAAVYDSATDYSNNVVAYDAADNGYYRQPGAIGGDGWYGEVHAAARPAAEVVRPAPVANGKTSFDLQNLATLALVKIGLAKLKLLATIKFLALLAVKLKALTLLKVLLLAKFAAISKLFNLLVLPFLPNVLMWLRNATLFQLNPLAAAGVPQVADAGQAAAANAAVLQVRNDSASAERMDRTAAARPDDGRSSLTATASLFRYVAAARSTECVERLACRVAGTRPLSFQSVWVDWILSSMASYIPNRKLKSYMSTFKDVSDYRLENIFAQPSTSQWLKWCDERYNCKEDSINNNLI